ncbi:MAG: sugar phosphate isomerase/epimerase family protein, partial [Armatimonadota bacterium]|nr:sugar phosphate isomerase/epimerase family protein [Armatimonadota bacterium]
GRGTPRACVAREVIVRIGLAGWALNKRFRAQENPLTMLEFFDVVRKEFDLDTVELNNLWLVSHEPDYLDAIVRAARKAGVSMEGMAVDRTGDLSLLDEKEREVSIRNAMAYFDVAERLGLAYFRVNTGGRPDGPPEMLQACIDSFRRLAEEGERRGIKIATENHGGLSTDPDMMVRLVQGVNSPAMATLPDLGNFPEEIVEEGIRKIMPWAANVHVKWTRRDAPGKRDIPALIKMVKETGFDGTLMIEDGGPVCDHMGVLELKGALIACLNSRLV